MIVRHFIQWVRTASAIERAEATRALARAYLLSEMPFEDRKAAEGALLMMLDDPSPMVREAMSQTLARSPRAPFAIVDALSRDQSAVALPVLEFSPLLVDADLVDIVATGNAVIQCAVARRRGLAATVSAAIAEVGCAQAVCALIGNSAAYVVAMSWERIVERLGHEAGVREALLALEGLPPALRVQLSAKLAETLTRFVVGKNWLSKGRASTIVGEVLERATVNAAITVQDSEMSALVRHLRTAGLLTGGLVLRALLSGNQQLVAHALAEITSVPLRRITTLLQTRGGGLEALLAQAGLPTSLYPAFLAAAQANDDLGVLSSVGGRARLRRRTCEQVLAACQQDEEADDALLVLLRKLTTESRREEARLFCDELAEVHQAWQANERLAA